MIQMLGAHASKECIKGLRQYTNLFQVLLQNPRSFELDPKRLSVSFEEYLAEVPDAHFVVHGPYNTNIMIDNKVIKPSIACIKAHLNVCSYFGIKHLVIHPGTRHFVSKTEDREVPLEESIQYVRGVLAKLQPFIASRGVKLLLENMSNTKMKGMPMEVLIKIAEEFAPQVGICFDLEHAYARGEDIKNFEKYMRIAEVIHFNTVPPEVVFGSGLDRHSNTSINESKGISPDQLKKWLVGFSHKIKILEMYSDTSERTFHELQKEVDNGEFAKKFLCEVS